MILYYPVKYNHSWLKKMYHYDEQSACLIHDDDGATSEAIGCIGLLCSDCIFYSDTMREYIDNSRVTLERYRERDDD